MNYRYSICYPDKPKPEWFENSISEAQVKNMFNSYPFEEELKKPDEGNFAPSLEFQNLTDSYRIIFSAFLENQKIWFQVTLLIPPNRPIEKFNDELFYKECDEIHSNFNQQDSLGILDLFLESKYKAIKQLMAERMIIPSKNNIIETKTSSDKSLLKKPNFIIREPKSWWEFWK